MGTWFSRTVSIAGQHQSPTPKCHCFSVLANYHMTFFFADFIRMGFRIWGNARAARGIARGTALAKRRPDGRCGSAPSLENLGRCFRGRFGTSVSVCLFYPLETALNCANHSYRLKSPNFSSMMFDDLWNHGDTSSIWKMLIISRRKVAGMIVSEGNCREIAVFQLGDLFFSYILLCIVTSPLNPIYPQYISIFGCLNG